MFAVVGSGIKQSMVNLDTPQDADTVEMALAADVFVIDGLEYIQ